MATIYPVVVTFRHTWSRNVKQTNNCTQNIQNAINISKTNFYQTQYKYKQTLQTTVPTHGRNPWQHPIVGTFRPVVDTPAAERSTTNKKMIPEHSKATGVVLEPTGVVLEPAGVVLELTGIVLEVTGIVLESTGFVLEP